MDAGNGFGKRSPISAHFSSGGEFLAELRGGDPGGDLMPHDADEIGVVDSPTGGTTAAAAARREIRGTRPAGIWGFATASSIRFRPREPPLNPTCFVIVTLTPPPTCRPSAAIVALHAQP